MASNIAKAYVQIIPSAQDVTPDGLADAMSGSMAAAGRSGGSKLLSGVKTVVSAGLAATAGAVSAAVVKTAKDAVAAYANYEQLAGGTELLYGDAASMVMDNASAAYKNMQMSANEYLQQVNGFSTGLKTALGGNATAAAELANRIVQAEADVVAATGVEAEAVQNAFNGIMKGNFTMLDNLQLGITPTKEGFQTLIDSVNAYNAAQGNATDYQIDNLADAQAALVDYIAMQGMAGYAAAEGSETIQGALATTKAAWENLLVGFNSGADISGLVQNLAASAGALAEQVTPVITGALSGIFAASPELLNSAAELLPELGAVITDNLPALASTAVDAVGTLAQGLVDGLPELGGMGMEIVTTLGEKLADAAPGLATTAMELIPQIVSGIGTALPQIVTVAGEIIAGLVSGLIAGFPDLITNGLEAVASLISGIGNGFADLLQAGWDIVGQLAEAIGGKVEDMFDAGANLVQGVIDGIRGKIADAVDAVQELANKLKEKFRLANQIESPSKVYAGYGTYITEGLIRGITGGTPGVVQSIGTLAAATQSTMRSGISAPVGGGSSATTTINVKSLSRADVDYIVATVQRRLGAMA